MNVAEPAAARMAPAPGIFSLVPVSVTDGQCTFSIELDPQEPYLDDHRPGGDPLLSTVMAVEAAVCGTRFFVPDATPASVRQVNVYEPCILSANRARAIDLQVTRCADVAAAFHCALSSMRDGRAVPHWDAIVTLGIPIPPRTNLPVSIPAQPRHFPQIGPSIDRAQVYSLFFHGPSFQVIDGAQYHDGMMMCRLSQHLGPSHRAPGSASQMAPRLIEFALQSAGLLEVAANRRMKIPHSIASIQRYLPLDVDAPMALFARASYGSSDAPGINVEITDISGRVILDVEEYRTVELPFDVSADKVTKLHAQLRGWTDIAS